MARETMTLVRTRDQELVEDFRKVFDLTHEELARATGISVSTWERIERGATDRDRTSRGVRNTLESIQEIMSYLYPIRFGDLRRWAVQGGRRSPKELMRRVGGFGQLLQQLRSQGDGVS